MSDNESSSGWRSNVIKAIRRMFSCHFRCCCSCNEDLEWIIQMDRVKIDNVARVKNNSEPTTPTNRMSRYESITDL